MERTWQRQERAKPDSGAELVLDYYLLTEQYGTFLHYGVQITMRCGALEESAAAADVTTTLPRAMEIIDRLACGTVTPAGLPDVLAELIG